MKIKVQSIHFDADKKLITYIEQKIQKVTGKFDNVISSDVILKIEKSTRIDNKIAEVKISVPGNDLFVKKQSQSFEESIDLATDALNKQLTKRKEKIRG